MKRCGPSCRHTRNASAVFKVFVLHPKKTFATISANGGHAGADLEQGINKRYERPADALSSGSMSDLAEKNCRSIRATLRSIPGSSSTTKTSFRFGKNDIPWAVRHAASRTAMDCKKCEPVEPLKAGGFNIPWSRS